MGRICAGRLSHRSFYIFDLSVCIFTVGILRVYRCAVLILAVYLYRIFGISVRMIIPLRQVDAEPPFLKTVGRRIIFRLIDLVSSQEHDLAASLFYRWYLITRPHVAFVALGDLSFDETCHRFHQTYSTSVIRLYHHDDSLRRMFIQEPHAFIQDVVERKIRCISVAAVPPLIAVDDYYI